MIMMSESVNFYKCELKIRLGLWITSFLKMIFGAITAHQKKGDGSKAMKESRFVENELDFMINSNN